MTVQVPFLVATIRPTLIVRSFRSGRARSRDAPVGPFLVSCPFVSLYGGVLRSAGCRSLSVARVPRVRVRCLQRASMPMLATAMVAACNRTSVRRTGVRVAGDSVCSPDDDCTGGMIPCRVISVKGDDITVRLTATRGAYKVNEILQHCRQYDVVPRASLVTRRWRQRILNNYRWEDS